MNEPIHEKLHLSTRPDDWADATDQEWTDAVNTGPRPVDPKFINYAQSHRPQAVCRALRLHEQLGGYLGPPAKQFLRRHGR